jgi:cellulose synthase/poly-beta-1,6-N-acetylglucosamine synthase-like glycosyltransferase
MNLLGISDGLVYLVIVIYFIGQTHLFVVSIAQFILLLHSIHSKGKTQQTSLPVLWPKITVQLPVYNEKYEVVPLLESIVKLDYPISQIEIQLLDDSTDETTSIAESAIKRLKERTGLHITHIHRSNREGFKAGALANGMKTAQGEFIAIFDADFRPPSHFLKQLIPHFQNQQVGMVQARCGYLNRNQTLVSRTLAFGMDIYYTIEQLGRYRAGVFFIFNGTGGIWRKQAIVDAGNWQSDTLAEDLDLSYRAQLNGWEFVYTDSVQANGELPPFIGAVRIQQYRWIKGSAECAKKILPQFFKHTHPIKRQFHALIQLSNSFAFISIFFCSLLSIPMMWIQYNHPIDFAPLAVFGFGSIVVLLQVGVSIYKSPEPYRGNNVWKEVFFYLPLSLVIFMGLYIENAKAALHGIVGKKTAFIRTPKTGTSNQATDYMKGAKLTVNNVFELLMIVYFVLGMGLAFVLNNYDFLLFHACLVVGYGLIFYHSVKEKFTLRN